MEYVKRIPIRKIRKIRGRKKENSVVVIDRESGESSECGLANASPCQTLTVNLLAPRRSLGIREADSHSQDSWSKKRKLSVCY